MGRMVDKRIREWIGKKEQHSVGKRNVFVSTGMEEKNESVGESEVEDQEKKNDISGKEKKEVNKNR